MGILGYKVYDNQMNLVETLTGTKPRKLLDNLRRSGHKLVAIRRKNRYNKIT